MQVEHESVVVGDATVQRLRELLDSGMQAWVSELGRVGRASDKGVEHAATACSHDVADDRCQLDVRVLEHLLEPLHLASPVPHELLSGSREIT